MSMPQSNLEEKDSTNILHISIHCKFMKKKLKASLKHQTIFKETIAFLLLGTNGRLELGIMPECLIGQIQVKKSTLSCWHKSDA